MVNEETSFELKIQDGALVDKFKRCDGKKIFKEKFGEEDFKWFWELMKNKVELMDHQHVEQTNKWKGEIHSIEQMLKYAFMERFESGWSLSFYEVLNTDRLDPIGKEVLRDLQPSKEEIEKYRERCGPTGYPLLKCLETRHKEEFHKLGSPPPPLSFDVFKDADGKEDAILTQKLNRVKCRKFRDAFSDQYKRVDAANLIKEMKEGERLLIFTAVQESCSTGPSFPVKFPSLPVGRVIAGAAVEQGLICIRKHFPNTTSEECIEEAEYFINGDWDGDMKTFMEEEPSNGKVTVITEDGVDCNYDNEVERTYNYLRSEQTKCLVVIEDCNGIEKNQRIGPTKPSGYLGNVIAGMKLPKARVVIITSCNQPEICPATCFRKNPLCRYACLRAPN